MNHFQAFKAGHFAEKLSTKAGFDLSAALLAGDENALKAHIDGLVAAAATKAAKPDVALTEENATLKTALDTATTENATLSLAANNFTVVNGALKATGFTFTTSSGTKPEEQIAAYKGALESHIKLRAQAMLGATGHAPIAEVAGDKTAKKMSRAAFTAMGAHEQMQFAKNGGELTD